MNLSQQKTIKTIKKYAKNQFDSFLTNTYLKELLFKIEQSKDSSLVFLTIKSKTKNPKSQLSITDKSYFVSIGKKGGIIKACDITEQKERKSYLTKCFRTAKKGSFYHYLSF